MHPPLSTAGGADTPLHDSAPNNVTSSPAVYTSSPTVRIPAAPQALTSAAATDSTNWETALGIIRKRMVRGQLQFLV